MSDKFVPTDINRVAVTGVAPQTDPKRYLPDARLVEIRARASGNFLNDVPAIAMQSADVIALVDELYELRVVCRPFWRRLWMFLTGRRSIGRR